MSEELENQGSAEIFPPVRKLSPYESMIADRIKVMQARIDGKGIEMRADHDPAGA